MVWIFFFDKGQIDRINVNGNYEPSNCRIVSAKENSRNRRKTKKMTAWGETKACASWAEDHRCHSEVKLKTIYNRLDAGWTPEDIISIGVSQIPGQGPNAPLIVAFGISKTLHEWFIDDRCLIHKKLLWERLNRGWNPEEAMTKSLQNPVIMYEGKTVHYWSKTEQCEVSYNTLKMRLESGMPLVQALKKKVKAATMS